MRQGGGTFRTWLSPRRALALAALGAAVGCGRAGSDSVDESPELPRYWQGSNRPSYGEAWATGAPWSPPPQAISSAPPLDAWAQSATTANSDPTTILPPATEPVSPANAFEGDQPASGTLLAPQAIAEFSPAPTDVAVVDEIPDISPPLPDAIAPAAPGDDTAAARTGDARGFARRTGLTPTDQTPTARTPAATTGLDAAGTPTGTVVNERATARIRRGYQLAERGAYFAARGEFIAALRMIAEAKDQRHGAPRRTLALVEGLRALDEADDFVPHAPGAGAGLSLAVIVSSHQTPVGKALVVDGLLPQQLAESYFQYAEVQLAAAVAREPAGSMALHALGKLHSQLGRVEPEKNPQAERRALALQQAALLARPDNHLAAHELGVLLAEGGHYAASEALLQQVAAHAPHPVVLRNLARVERQMGRPDLAAAAERHAEWLASRGGGAGDPVQWVSADALARTPDTLGPATPSTQIANGSPRSAAPAPMTARGPAPALR